ncbi:MULTISPECIES: hypothetical protein [Leptospira]|uniref:Uncharacterized protein n=4 Tax=Leptospira borgpetersenii TaxID=174 RepID=A0A0E3B7N7_LEPBO|nr:MULTISPECIES: hypothetical protein [Leptospira]ALO25835.1 hypothetical protein LBBP_01546 [Leptospira borgpetersenii serovar Ballum]ANH00641.2 Uncharacterized protein LB4E_1251 [Leptospira borgpetersenii str. 4E]AXX17262.1 hypothetical protein C4Q31_11500 [Leptospira borgpetersenii serovar Ceylonica]EKP12167.1 hypothetical protein LEP1GSC128_0230 [Leptospira borgpetersenii str. 200801926]EKQ90807.1 hypothetical protein LEP1GSC101_1224 [Leptospira borgpetersenii str. UI 09149]
MELENVSLKDKIIRAIVAFFLFILVSGLIITFLPGDAEKSFFDVISGRSNLNAGKIGSDSIPMDYFQAAQRDCFFQYRNIAPSLAEDPSTLQSCAFQTIRSLVVTKQIANATGFSVSETGIREELSEEARRIYRESVTGAGYSEEDVRKPEVIYKQILNSAPMQYRVDRKNASSLYDSLLNSDLKKTDGELAVQKESSSARFRLRIVSYTDEQLNKLAEKEIPVSEEVLRVKYENEKKEGKLPKNPDGKELSFEERKNFLKSKLLLEARSKSQEEWKGKLKTLQEETDGLQKIASLLGVNVQDFKDQSLLNLWELKSGNQNIRLGNNTQFLKDLTTVAFGSKKVGGPYRESEKNVFVEFASLEIDSSKINISQGPDLRDNLNLLNGFVMEISQALQEKYPIERRIGQKAEE